VDQDAELLLGSDDGFAVWMNGSQVGANLEVGRWAQPTPTGFRCDSKKDGMCCFVKITQMGGEWGFCVRFCGLRAPVAALRPGESLT